jgi:glycosyltransferase involved in cell wall biosynthesis
VVLVINELGIAGAETQLVRLARALVGRGDDVSVLCLLPTVGMQHELDAMGVPVDYVHQPARLRGAAAIVSAVRLLRRRRPDVLISFIYQANVVARLAGRLTGVPVIVSSIRNEHFGGRHRELLVRLTDRFADVTTVNSELAARSLRSRGVVSAARLEVVRNGIDPAQLRRPAATRARVRGELGVADDEFLWLAVGRLTAQKDYPNLLDAFARLRGRGAPARLCIAGTGPLAEDLDAAVRAADLGGAVRFLGLRDDVPDLLSAADGLVLSSRWEGLPNVVLEAMAAGRPVGATDVGGTRELVEEGVTGHLVVPGRPDLLAAAMGSIVGARPEERAEMGRRATEAVDRGFHIDAISRQWLELIDGQLARAGAVDGAAPQHAPSPS